MGLAGKDSVARVTWSPFLSYANFQLCQNFLANTSSGQVNRQDFREFAFYLWIVGQKTSCLSLQSFHPSSVSSFTAQVPSKQGFPYSSRDLEPLDAHARDWVYLMRLTVTVLITRVKQCDLPETSFSLRAVIQSPVNWYVVLQIFSLLRCVVPMMNAIMNASCWNLEYI